MAEAPRDENRVPTALFEVDGSPGTVEPGQIDQATGRILVDLATGGGDVTGPASSTDNAVVRFNGTSGKDIQNSGVTIDDTNNIAGLVNLTQTGYQDISEITTPTNPAANVGRLYVADSAGTTTLFFRDSAGTETNLLAASVGANTALSNLASVAINTSLISDTDNTDDLGSAAIGWRDVYSRTLRLDGSTSGTTILQPSAAASGTLTLPATTDTLIGRTTTDTLTNKTLTTPTIGNFTNATHNHTNAAGGGQLDITNATTGTLGVPRGGTGATTFTDGGILLGSGTGAITALGVATNGQIPIGDGTGDPVLATIGGTTNEITVTNGAGSITLSLPNSVEIPTALLDDNGNETINFVATASAVNNIQVTNAAASGDPQIAAIGSDTNIDLDLTAKGTGVVRVSGSEAEFTETAYFDAEVDNGNSGTADTIDWTAGNKQRSTLTGNVTFTFTEPTGPCNLIFKLIQDATGSRTVTWPADVNWPGGTAPTLTTTANATDIVSFYYDGTDFYGQVALNFS